MENMTVLRAGPLTTVQDLGRPAIAGKAFRSAGRSTVLAARVANLLVGNRKRPPSSKSRSARSPALSDRRAIAWCGGTFTRASETDRDSQPDAPPASSADEELKAAPAQRGGRAWLAISGGIEVPPVLGSRIDRSCAPASAGLDGRALRDGDEIPLGKAAPARSDARVATWSAPAEWSRSRERASGPARRRGAEWDEFPPEAASTSCSRNRLPSRRKATAWARGWPAPNCGATRNRATFRGGRARNDSGAHDGQPIILLGDCQTIGGYPKIAHVITVDLPLAAQLRPNDIVRFQRSHPGGGACTLRRSAKAISICFASALRLRTL